jgi:nitrous oxidase accessory protein NosD
MKLRCLCTLMGLAVAMIATGANAAVHRVFPGGSIQAAIDKASPGDTILVEPGVYHEDPESRYGLRIATDNLRLVGKVNKGQGEAGKVRLIANGKQRTGVYAAPPGCEFDQRDSCDAELKGFYLRGFSVEEFPVNGIQTRWVDGFEFVQNASVNNLNNGIYPTLSANGLVRNNVSYGSLDTAMWVAASQNVRVIGNELFGSVIGLEITVSDNVEVKQNEIYDNSVGVGLFHPNAAGNAQIPVMENWVIEQNNIYNNNRPNNAPAGSFQGLLPRGAGILLLGVSGHVIAKNKVEGNDFVGIGVLDWCSAVNGTPNNCVRRPPIALPFANNNRVSQNYLSGNGRNPPAIPINFLAADLTYFDSIGSSGNCFEDNRSRPRSLLTFFSSKAYGQLPTDGC